MATVNGMRKEPDYTAERRVMIRTQLQRRGITDQRVLQAMREVPRHAFVPPEWRHEAYSDRPLPIADDQTISQPYMVAIMTQSLALQGHEHVLEVGTGSGYQAAVLSRLAAQVYTIEYFPDLAERARAILQHLGYANVQVTPAMAVLASRPLRLTMAFSLLLRHRMCPNPCSRNSRKVVVWSSQSGV